jgi:CheY-like chemotaxis protein
VQEILGAEGIEVDACTSGADAWEILKRNDHYDAVIIDNNLPAVSGLELVLRVRSIPHRRSLPIIMLSADDCEKKRGGRASMPSCGKLKLSNSIRQSPESSINAVSRNSAICLS